MSLPPLTIIPAGAGSGKTHAIQEQLGAWVLSGEVAPERIVAVTFTEAAAAELRERIGAKLIALDRIDDALRLDQAYISTIHGFGLRVLSEFAFEAGTSPRPRLLNEAEKNALVRIAMSRTTQASAVAADLAAHGYRYDFNSGRSAEDCFRADVLGVVEKLRAIGWRPGEPLDIAGVVEAITSRYGPVVDGAALSATLRRNVEALLTAFPESFGREFPGNKSASNSFFQDFGNLKRAMDGSAIDSDWNLWKALRKLRVSKRGAELPEGYDELATAVMETADQLPRHSGALRHACDHIEALLRAGQDVLVEYENAKRAAGLVDYSDMIALAGQLLRDRPEVLAELASRIDCLVIDEFQDTNPLQFALLWQLRGAGIPTMVVGDLKQAIMGFQGADPRLFAALLEQHGDLAAPLTQNWRSQPRLMEFVNAVGPGLFSGEYVQLAPRGGESTLGPLEFVSFGVKAKKAQKSVCAMAVGERLKALLDDPGQQIVDRHTRAVRRLRGGDIAVLCPTHVGLECCAEVFRALGLRVRLPADGWFDSRPVQIARYALAYLANPADRHAALYLAVTELGSLGLQEGLQQLMDGGAIEDPVLQALDTLAPGVADRTIYALVADTIKALRLFDVVASWPDADQARANLLMLQALAGEFMDANREALAYGGFHGAGVQTFLAWLDVRREEKDGDKQPEPRVLDQDAIVLSTWHSAKGREWPVVAVCGLEKAIAGRLPNLEIGYSSFDDLGRLLECARLEYSPEFAASETNEKFMEKLQAAAEVEARRLLYVAMTRARDKLVMEWPAYLDPGKGPTYWSVLAVECGLSVGEDAVKVGEAEFPCAVIKGGVELPEEWGVGEGEGEVELAPIGRRGIRAGDGPGVVTPDSRTPSSHEPAVVAAGVELEVMRYGEVLEPDMTVTGAALGTFMHRCFEVLGARPEFVERIPSITGLEAPPAWLAMIAAGVSRFEAWVALEFAGGTVRREWPLLALDEYGSVVSGTADLVVETADGVWVIDHKSDQVVDPLASFVGYLPQLEAYAQALAQQGFVVLGVAVNWMRRGEVTLQRWGA